MEWKKQVRAGQCTTLGLCWQGHAEIVLGSQITVQSVRHACYYLNWQRDRTECDGLMLYHVNSQSLTFTPSLTSPNTQLASFWKQVTSDTETLRAEHGWVTDLVILHRNNTSTLIASKNCYCNFDIFAENVCMCVCVKPTITISSYFEWLSEGC